ncbi:MAG: glycosyltransferase family 2 protein [bacterium]|nr:glycosyltransferase family 2 protein [bacterium]
MSSPVFSIVVVCLNEVKNIKRTLESVLCQTFDNYEIIVKDGLSSDGTLEQIPQSDKIRVYSQQDKGIYNGMNQALAYISGRYVLFLNCGDILENKFVLEHVHKVIKKHRKYDCVVYGDYIYKAIHRRQVKTVTKYGLFRKPLCHQTQFICAGLFKKYGLYDENYKICADAEFIMRIFFKGAKFFHAGSVICDYMGDGVSESSDCAGILKNEERRIRRKYYPFRTRLGYNIVSVITLKWVRQFLVSKKVPQVVRNGFMRFFNLFTR